MSSVDSDQGLDERIGGGKRKHGSVYYNSYGQLKAAVGEILYKSDGYKVNYALIRSYGGNRKLFYKEAKSIKRGGQWQSVAAARVPIAIRRAAKRAVAEQTQVREEAGRLAYERGPSKESIKHTLTAYLRDYERQAANPSNTARARIEREYAESRLPQLHKKLAELERDPNLYPGGAKYLSNL